MTNRLAKFYNESVRPPSIENAIYKIVVSSKVDLKIASYNDAVKDYQDGLINEDSMKLSLLIRERDKLKQRLGVNQNAD